jgi:enoyl-CoA hydratase/carnithine racemase
MSYQLLLVERKDKVALVTLNRPEKRNALSIALRNEIDQCLAELETDDEVSVVVIAAEGPAFCAGFDTSEFSIREPEHMKAVEDSSNRYHLRLANFTKPLIAAVNGPAMGGGMDLAVLCDVRIAAENAAFAHPEIKFGAPSLYGPLKDIIGGGLARDLCLTGRRIDAQEALRIGLVSQVVPPGELLDAALSVARTIAEAPLGTLKVIKAFIKQSYVWRFEDAQGGLFAAMG